VTHALLAKYDFSATSTGASLTYVFCGGAQDGSDGRTTSDSAFVMVGMKAAEAFEAILQGFPPLLGFPVIVTRYNGIGLRVVMLFTESNPLRGLP